MGRRISRVMVMLAAVTMTCAAGYAVATADPMPPGPLDVYEGALPRGGAVEVLAGSEVGDATRDYLQAMADLLVEGTAEEDATTLARAKAYFPESEQHQRLCDAARAWRDKTASNASYESARVVAHPETQRLGDDGRLYVGARVETNWRLAGEDFDTGAADHHVFVLEDRDGSWQLVEDRFCEPPALLPESEGTAFTYVGTSDYGGSPRPWIDDLARTWGPAD